VAFLIDDLEKSEAAYVVELLDSVLALIREAPPDTGPLTVLVLVVGDREWIKESLETVHKGPKYGAAAGRSSAEVRIGELFDLIVPVPSPTVALQGERLARALDEGGLPASREALQASLREASSEAEVLRFLRKAVPPAPEQEEPASGPSSREGQDATANGLQRFLELLPPIPRERRRFVNQYVTELSLHIVEDRVVPAEALARWIILGIRWPALTRFLSSFPEAVQYLGADNLPTEIPEELRPLFRSQTVEQVVKSPDAPLTPELIRDLALL
jgi:hypothetical protein